MRKDKNPKLFDYESEEEAEWREMPEFKHKDKTFYKQLVVNFETKEDFEYFKKFVDKAVSYKTKSCCFPKSRLDKSSNYYYDDE